MKILVIGSGAREHAVLRSFDKEGEHNLFVVGGNPGIWDIAQQAKSLSGEPIKELDNQAISEYVNNNQIDLVVVGPEAPLDNGVVDYLKTHNSECKVFGPTKMAAKLESSKSFAKDVMQNAGIPTAKAIVCKNESDLNEAFNVFGNKYPYVVKADGLMAGKGVIVTSDVDEAKAHANGVFNGGGFVIVEEYLDGPEFSLFFICDGLTAVPMIPAQDFKRIYDGDLGPNTGGMGSYTPLYWLEDQIVDKCASDIAQKVVDYMQTLGTPFVGILFAGLIKTSDGIKVIEFNVRFGDPETQVVLEKMTSKLSAVLLMAADGKLSDYQKQFGKLKFDNQFYCNVVLASQGYPQTSSKGDLIDGISAARAKGAVVLEAGTAYSNSDIGAITTNGGRVLSVIASGKDLSMARSRTYNYVKMISFKNMQFRNDIALKAVNKEI